MKDEGELVSPIQAVCGTETATLAVRAYPHLFRVLQKRLIGNSLRGLDAEDLLQESLAAALKSLAGKPVKDADEFTSYVLAIAHRRLIDASRRRRSPLPHERELVAIDSRPELPDQAIAAEHGRELRRTVAGLRRPYRWALLLRMNASVRWEVVQLAIGCDTVHAARCVHGRARTELARKT